ncbi:MAG: bacteriophage spanin2 family protein [Kibdelosporangium sp.]
MKRFAPVVVGAGLVIALAGCGAIEEVQQTADSVSSGVNTATVCVDAIRIAGFTPDTANPQAAVDKAQATGNELSALASKAADTTVNDAINDLATTMKETTVSDLTSGPAAWIQRKAEQVSALTKACSP